MLLSGGESRAATGGDTGEHKKSKFIIFLGLDWRVTVATQGHRKSTRIWVLSSNRRQERVGKLRLEIFCSF